MAISINRMGVFKRVAGNGDKIVNLNVDERNNTVLGLTTNGKYRWYNPFRGIRSQATVDANRQTREMLLRNLRTTFGLENNANYMAELRQRLGDDVLKSEDFDADANGKVHSSCPLTERRITAIMNRVKQLAEQEKTEGIEPVREVTDEIVNRRLQFIDEEIVEPFFNFMQEERTVQIMRGSEMVTLNGVTFRPPSHISALNASKSSFIQVARQFAEVGRDGLTPTRVKNRLANLRGAGGLIVEPFVNTTIVADGVKIRGGAYYEQLVNEKIEELIANFNRKHPDIALV